MNRLDVKTISPNGYSMNGMQRPVRRICMTMLGLKGLESLR